MELIQTFSKKKHDKSLIKMTNLVRIVTNPKFDFSVHIVLFITYCILIYFLIVFESKVANTPMIIMSIFCFIIFLVVSTSSINHIIKLNRTINYLKDSHMHLKNAYTLNEDLRIVKHDFSNIIQCMGGYIINNDMCGLNSYYEQVQKEFGYINSLCAIDSGLISDSALYNLLSLKYSDAKQKGISFNINISSKLDELPISSYKLTRILGILLDNAIDASKNCETKEIYFEINSIYVDGKIQKYLITIQNTYTNKDVDVCRIREKGYTSKGYEKGSHGLGLWEANKIIKKSKNLNLNTYKNEDYFVQKLEIFVF